MQIRQTCIFANLESQFKLINNSGLFYCKVCWTHSSKVLGIGWPWSSLVEGGEGLFLPNCQTNLVIALYMYTVPMVL